MAEPWTDGEVLTATHLAGLPWGVIGYANGSTSDQTGITTVTDITGLTVTWTASASRLYRTTLHIQQCVQNTSAAGASFVVADASNAQISGSTLSLAANALGGGVVVVSLETGLSGSVTRKGRATTNGGTLTISGSSTVRSSIIVEDLGPA